MLGLGNPIHILILLVVLLLVFGAKRLPEMGKSLGDGLRGFKDSVSADTPTENPLYALAAHADGESPASAEGERTHAQPAA